MVVLTVTMFIIQASVLAAAAERGITFDKTLEVRGVEDIEESIAAEIAPPADATLASSTAATMTHSKPSRPGKGKAKVAKFQA